MFAIAAAAGLVIAGCGEGAPGMVLGAEDYKQQVNDLCGSLNADFEQLTGEADDDAETLAALLPKLEDRNREFLELTPPDELKDAGDSLALSNQEQLAATQAAADAAEADDQKAYRFALAELERVEAERDERATELGAEDCAG